MFDISEIQALDGDVVNLGLDMPLKHPITGEKTGAVWTVASYDSKAYKALERQLRTNGLKAARTNKFNAEMMDDNTLDLISSLVVDWRGMSDGKGKALEFSKKNLKELLLVPIAGSNFIEQIDTFASNGVVFFKASKNKSPMPLDTK